MNFVEAKNSRPLIKAALKNPNGGGAMILAGDRTRTLDHAPLRDAPMTRLPWPLSIFQPHNVQYRVFKGNETFVRKRFKWSQVDNAVNEFLEGIDEDEMVNISGG